MIIYQEENNFWAEFTQLVVKSWVYQKCRILAEKPTILWQTKLTNTPLWGSDENVCISNVCVGWYFFPMVAKKVYKDRLLLFWKCNKKF